MNIIMLGQSSDVDSRRPRVSKIASKGLYLDNPETFVIVGPQNTNMVGTKTSST